MGVLGDLKREKEDAAEYGLADFDRAPLKPIVLPPVAETFAPDVPQALDLDAPEEIEDFLCPTDFLEPVKEPAEQTVIETVKGAGFQFVITQCGREYRGEVTFASRKKKERLFGNSLPHLRNSLYSLASQSVTMADLHVDSGEPTPSNREPSMDFRNGQQ